MNKWKGFVIPSFLAAVLLVSFGLLPLAQAQDPTNPNERAVFQKFTAKAGSPEQAINKAYAKAGIVWDRFLNLPQVTGTKYWKRFNEPRPCLKKPLVGSRGLDLL